MILPNDEDTIRRMLGVQEIPTSVLPEYVLWLRMHHRDGASGPLGHDLCLCLLRSLKLEPPKVTERAQDVDWRSIPVGTKVVIKDGHTTSYGTYRGKVDYGTLGVMIENSAFVQEVNARFVQPHQVATDIKVVEEDRNEAYETASRGDEIDLDEGPIVNWEDVKRGDTVYVVDDEASIEGTFWQRKDGHVVVKVGSEKVSYPQEAVLPERK